MHLVVTSEWEGARILIAAGADTGVRENRGRTAAELLEELELVSICPPADIASALGISG